MSVLENMMTGLHRKSTPGCFAPGSTRAMRARGGGRWRARARDALGFVGMSKPSPTRPGHALSFGQQRIVEIARTLISEPKMVLLDEPAVGLSPNRVAELDALLRRIRDEKGVTLVMIEHVVRLVMGVSERVVVLNSGQKHRGGPPRGDPAGPGGHRGLSGKPGRCSTLDSRPSR